MSVKIGIFGLSGRMGKMIAKEALDDAAVTLVGGTVREGGPHMKKNFVDVTGLPLTDKTKDLLVTISSEKLLSESDVVIDFTRPEVSVHHAYVAAALGKPVVIGTTGFTTDHVRMLTEAANHIPIVLAANMSVGVNLLLAISELAAQALDPRYDIEIVEMHHKHKIDAPSGTALALGEAVAAGRQVALKSRAVYDRKGNSGPRKKGDIGFATLRGGDVVGEHTVLFAGDGERLELTHKATDRRVFAQGAVVAAKWLTEQNQGCFSMKDVLGF